MGLLYPASIRPVWCFETSLSGHVNKKLSPQHSHQTSCTGGPFVLCFRIFIFGHGRLLGWSDGRVGVRREKGEERVNGWTQELHKNMILIPYWFRFKKNFQPSNQPSSLSVLFVYSNSIPPLYNQSCHSLAFPMLSAPAAYTHRHTHRCNPRTHCPNPGSSLDSNNNEDVVNLSKRAGGLQHRRVIN